MSKNVLSLFDGMSCLQVALRQTGIKVDKYFASEINEGSIQIAQSNFPTTIQVGDVRQLTKKDLPKIWLISAGSPCQNLSLAGNMKGLEVTSFNEYMRLKKMGYKFEGDSCLFWEFIRLVKELKPKYFFLENVKMSPVWKHIITTELGMFPLHINSSLLTAQNRDRIYWTNIPNASIPMDKKIMIGDVIPEAVGGNGIRGRKNKVTSKYDLYETTRTDGKSNCVVTKNSSTCRIKFKDGSVRQMTISEAEKLQGLPKNYTDVQFVTKGERFHAIGNGWTIPVIKHLVKGLK